MVIDPEFPWKLPRASHSPNWLGYKHSISEWKDLLVRAEQRGDPEAEWEVADRFSDGCRDEQGKVVVRRSPRKAAEWFRRSAEHGYVDAYINLGNILGEGDGVEKNVPEALLWLRKAFRAGHTCAANNAAVTHRQNANLRMAVQWFRKAVAAGDDGALIDLGIHYYWGKGVRRNPKAAVQCFRKATKGKDMCEAQRDNAYFYLGVAYLEGKGVKKSIPTAWKLFVRANVDNDHPAALKMLQQLGQLK